MATPESAFSLRRRLYAAIIAEKLDQSVLKELLPEGRPHLFERQMWDYKQELPLTSSTRLSPAEKEAYEVRLAEVMKDIVSFYNSYGGYLVIGVQDSPREVIGFSGAFNCDEVNKRILGTTKREIGCTYGLYEIRVGNERKTLGLLFVPQRPDTVSPAQFKKDAPLASNGKKAYSSGDIYFRQGDECLPAKSSEDFSFLCSQGRRKFVPSDVVSVGNPLSNNLRERDPGFIKFIGRDEYLQKLWQWLLDRYSPGKLLAGVGGIGKTTIAREFAEQLIKSSPFGFERVIWFSAKKRYYTASVGKYTPTLRVDFFDLTTLLRILLRELGTPEAMIQSDWSTDDLIDEVLTSLKIIPAFVVIDDVDSLEPAMQQEVFHTMLQIMTRAIRTDGVSSRVLLTARLDLGASPGQLVLVSGLEPIEFGEYVEMTAQNLELQWSLKAKSPRMKEFHSISSGSPTFAASILRLMTLGEPLSSALSTWRKSDGDEVRAFAFEKELNNLSDSQIRTLYAMCILGDSSQLELKQVTQSSSTLLQDDLGELRKYHLISTAGETPKGGARLTVPNWIRLMRDLIKSKVREPKRIEAACANARSESPDLEGEVGRWIYRVVALWRNESMTDALEVAQQAAKKFPEHPDIRCLLGRAYLRVTPPNARQADAAFRKATELRCKRVELLQLWIIAKKKLRDWVGILEITDWAGELVPSEEILLIRSEAYGNLADIANRSRDYKTASKHWLIGIDEIEGALARQPSMMRLRELFSTRALLYHNYVLALDRSVSHNSDYLDVWKATVRAFRQDSISHLVLQLGIERLVDWWEWVEQRPTSKGSLDVLKNQRNILYGMAETLSKRGVPDTALIKAIEIANLDLGHRASKYAFRIKP
jgi:SpoVK/Ycf46/Vps4 family AAA+-type ATPase